MKLVQERGPDLPFLENSKGCFFFLPFFPSSTWVRGVEAWGEETGSGRQGQPWICYRPSLPTCPSSTPAGGPQRSKRSRPLSARTPLSGPEAETSRTLRVSWSSSLKYLFHSQESFITSCLICCPGLEVDSPASCWPGPEPVVCAIAKGYLSRRQHQSPVPPIKPREMPSSLTPEQASEASLKLGYPSPPLLPLPAPFQLPWTGRELSCLWA